MNFQWAEGFHAPKGISADDVAKALDKLKEPSPDNLFNASKQKRHVLHDALWGEGDQVWANRGRLEYCRKIISAVQRVEVVGGHTIATRAVEFVKVSNNRKQWAGLDQILSDPDLEKAHLESIHRLQLQAAAKMARFIEARDALK